MRVRPAILALATLAACAPPAPPPAPEAPAAVVAPERGPGGRRTAEGFDTSSADERAAAAVSGGGALLGRTVASLGPVAEQGFWLRTGLVSRERPGRVALPGGASVAVTLRPSGRDAGAGSELSLAAFRVLGLSLAALPEIEVFAQ